MAQQDKEDSRVIQPDKKDSRVVDPPKRPVVQPGQPVEKPDGDQA